MYSHFEAVLYIISEHIHITLYWRLCGHHGCAHHEVGGHSYSIMPRGEAYNVLHYFKCLTPNIWIVIE